MTLCNSYACSWKQKSCCCRLCCVVSIDDTRASDMGKLNEERAQSKSKPTGALDGQADSGLTFPLGGATAQLVALCIVGCFLCLCAGDSRGWRRYVPGLSSVHLVEKNNMNSQQSKQTHSLTQGRSHMSSSTVRLEWRKTRYGVWGSDSAQVQWWIDCHMVYLLCDNRSSISQCDSVRWGWGRRRVYMMWPQGCLNTVVDQAMEEYNVGVCFYCHLSTCSL